MTGASDGSPLGKVSESVEMAEFAAGDLVGAICPESANNSRNGPSINYLSNSHHRPTQPSLGFGVETVDDIPLPWDFALPSLLLLPFWTSFSLFPADPIPPLLFSCWPELFLIDSSDVRISFVAEEEATLFTVPAEFGFEMILLAERAKKCQIANLNAPNLRFDFPPFPVFGWPKLAVTPLSFPPFPLPIGHFGQWQWPMPNLNPFTKLPLFASLFLAFHFPIHHFRIP